MPGRQLLMSFPVTATSHTLAEYRARGGYASLAKALRMKPSDVIKEVAASGLQGRGAGSAAPLGVAAAASAFKEGNLIDGLISAIRVLSAGISRP